MKWPIKIFISIGLITLFVMQMDAGNVSKLFTQLQPSLWLYALAFVVLQLLILSLRWMILINIGHKRMSYAQSLQVTIASLLANTLFIASITGIFVRIAMALQYGSSLFKAVFATGVDRMMTLIALILLSALFLPTLGSYFERDLYRSICLFIGLFILIAFVFTPLFIKFLLDRLPRFKLSKANIVSGIRYLKVLLNNNRLTGKVIAASLIAQCCFFVSIYCVSLSTGVELSLLELMTVLPIISLVASIPISIGGWGIREGAFIYGLGLLGVPMETAFFISVQTGLISLLATMVIGIPALLDFDFSQLRIRINSLSKARTSK